MLKAALCVVATTLPLLSIARADTFVIPAGSAGQVATVKIPVGAVTNLSANSAQSLDDYADRQVEAMRLSGNVVIRIEGVAHPIEIKAESVVLELTPDRPAERAVDKGRQEIDGNVVFDLQTPSGPMRIAAGRVERQAGIEPQV